MSLLDVFTSPPERGVISLTTCGVCGRAVPVFGHPGEGRSANEFDADYLCHGHAVTTDTVRN